MRLILRGVAGHGKGQVLEGTKAGFGWRISSRDIIDWQVAGSIPRCKVSGAVGDRIAARKVDRSLRWTVICVRN